MSGMARVCNSSLSITPVFLGFYVDGNLAEFFETDLAGDSCDSPRALINYAVGVGSHSVTFGAEGTESNAIYNWDDRIDILVP